MFKFANIKFSKIHFIFLGLILLGGQFVPPAAAKMRSNNKIRAGIPPYEVIKKVINANNKALMANDYSKEFSYTPYMTWLTETDARISDKLIADDSTVFYSVRNMGNQIELSAGAIDYGVRHLLTPILLITSSSDSNAVKFFMEGYAALAPAIRRELDHLNLALSGDNKKDDFQERLITNIEANVDYQVGLAMARYQDRVNSGRLVVIGSVLDFANVYKHGAGRLILININGEKKLKSLLDSGLLKSLKPEFKKINIGRERPVPPPSEEKKPDKKQQKP